MENKIKITAICGWALSEQWFRDRVAGYFPHAEVQAHYPDDPEDPKAAARVFETKPDWVIGYSLGSLWLLFHKEKIHPQTRMILMTPILAFPKEKNLGGKTPLGKLKYQKKMLSSSENYSSALKGFFDLSGIRFSDEELQAAHSREVLIRGLEFLETASVSPESSSDCMAITGLRDPLLDGNRLKELIPHLVLLEDCDHSPDPILHYVSQNNKISAQGSIPSSGPILSQRAL